MPRYPGYNASRRSGPYDYDREGEYQRSSGSFRDQSRPRPRARGQYSDRAHSSGHDSSAYDSGQRYNRPPGNYHSRGASYHDPRDGPDSSFAVRTLFVRNIKSGATIGDIAPLFEEFGELYDVCDHISRKGIAFISFYDLRAATRALESLNGREINGIPIDVRYSLPKNDEAFKEFCDRHKNQGTLLVTARDCPLPLNDSDLRSYFQQFGDVASFKPFRSNERQRLVEYYDSRDCIRANDMAHGTEYNGGTLHCRFIWDLNQKLMTRQSVDAERAKSVRGRGVRGPERSSSFRGHHEGEGDYGRGHYRRSSPPPRRQRYSPGQSRERYLAGRSSRETSVTRPRDDPHRAPPPAQATLDAQRLQQAQQAQQLISNMMSGQASNLNQTQQPAINPAAALQMAANSPQGFQLAQLMNLFGQIQTNPQMLNIQSLVNPAILQALVGGAAAGAAGHTPASLAAGEKAVTTPAGIPNVPALAPTPAPVSIPTSITSLAPVSAATTNISQLLGNGLGLSVKQPMETTLPTPGVSRERPESSVTTPTTAMATTISSGMVGQPPESVGASVPPTNLLSPPHVTATPTTSIAENLSKSTWAPVTTTAETSLSPQTSTTPAAVVSTPSTTQPGTTATTVSHASLYYNPITSQGSSDMYGAPGTEADSRMDEYTYY